MNDARAALNALLRRDLRAFIQKVFNTAVPGELFENNWHLEAIAAALERVRTGKCKRLIINLPPRSLKSLMASVALPAFLLGLDPTARIICCSYSNELAKHFSSLFRRIVESEWYRGVFPRTQVSNKNTEIETVFTQGGSRLATSVHGTLLGRGAKYIIIDDPMKPEDALSDVRRAGTNAWATDTLFSRLDDKRSDAIIVVMQRLHVDDLTGFLLGRSDEWEVLNLPAIAPADIDIPVWDGFYSWKAGEPLSPREPLEVLDKIKRDMGSDTFAAQYLQQPVPPGGAMIKRVWVRRYDELPPEALNGPVTQSWDTANKGGATNDWSVCTTWRRWQQRLYLVDVFRARLDYPELKAAVKAQAARHRARKVLIEDAGTGTALIQELRGQVRGIIGVKPVADKVIRMSVASARFEAGEIYLPTKAAWLADLEAELFAFPGARHDDQCDSISQALKYVGKNNWSNLTPDQYNKLMEAAGRMKHWSWFPG